MVFCSKQSGGKLQDDVLKGRQIVDDRERVIEGGNVVQQTFRQSIVLHDLVDLAVAFASR